MPKICLCLIVKDESAVIERCLDSHRAYIDAVAICDTGSSDDTREKIVAWCTTNLIPFKLQEDPWEDYSTNRNKALNLARSLVGPDDYIMLSDADDVFTGPAYLKEALVDKHDGYMCEFRLNNLVWPRPFLVRAGAGWQYFFKCHELILRRAGDGLDGVPTLKGCHVDCNVDGAYQGAAHFLAQAAILETEQNEPRSVFYLAQSYHCAGPEHYPKAVQYYAKRASMGGYMEEIVVSYIRIGEIMSDPGCFLEAARLNPTRAEGLFNAAVWCRAAGMEDIALALATKACTKKAPQGMFLDTTVYNGRAEALRKELQIAIVAAKVWGPALKPKKQKGKRKKGRR